MTRQSGHLLSGKRIGFVGGGAMAEALAGGLIGAGLEATQITIAEPDDERRASIGQRLGVETTAENELVVRGSDLTVLAVKPNIIPAALDALARSDVDPTGPLWISIAAGVTLDALGSRLGDRARIVRAMPNTPALVQAAATAIVGNAETDRADLDAAQALFESVGIVWQAGREELLDAVTGLSGSGPAYVFLFIEGLIEAGEKVGLGPEAARALALQTVFGAAKLARESDRSPAQLREQVSSKGGTTVEGLAALEQGGLRETITRAVEAATRRSRELGRPSNASDASD